jgi:hypothetical protein
VLWARLAGFRCHELGYAPAGMEPSAPRSFPPVEAGALLAGVTLGGVGAGAAIGWGAGSVADGVIGGLVVGLPGGVLAVYRRYRHFFS